MQKAFFSFSCIVLVYIQQISCPCQRWRQKAFVPCFPKLDSRQYLPISLHAYNQKEESDIWHYLVSYIYFRTIQLQFNKVAAWVCNFIKKETLALFFQKGSMLDAWRSSEYIFILRIRNDIASLVYTWA